MTTNITIIGFGTMGKAIVGALRKYPSVKISVIDINKKETKNIKNSDFIMLSVKPQDARDATTELKQYRINKNTILISIMAGVSIDKLARLSGHKKIIRMMPNLGLSVGAGIGAWKGVGLSSKEIKKVKNFINKITEN